MSEVTPTEPPLYKLVIRFSNGEGSEYAVEEPLNPSAIGPGVRFAVIRAVGTEDRPEGSEVAVVNLREVSILRTERVTLGQIASEKRTAGLWPSATAAGDDRRPRNLVRLSFI